MAAASTTASAAAATTTTSAAPAAGTSTASATISTWPAISARPLWSSVAYWRRVIPIEVWLGLIVEIPAALDRQSRDWCSCRFASAIRRRRFSATHLRALLFQNRFARQPDAIAFDRQHLHQHLVAFFQFVANILDAMLGDFADVQQTVGTGHNLDKRSEIRQPRRPCRDRSCRSRPSP